MPTLEDITHELNEATVFSHLDMNYHQLELQENSLDITTFSTHVGYKRLNFGMRSVCEIFKTSWAGRSTETYQDSQHQ